MYIFFIRKNYLLFKKNKNYKNKKLMIYLKEHIKDDLILNIAEISQKLNIDTYLVGGYVRDFFLKKNVDSYKDLDITCLGDPSDLVKKIGEKYKVEQINHFKNFGTIMIKIENKELEFVCARKESYQKNSRNPKVEKGSLKQDIERRDFTINTMAISLNKENFGQLIDMFNGFQDLENKILRTPLDAKITFSDDPLRILRAIRFASTLQMQIGEEEKNAIKKTSERLSIISFERISCELNKILMSEKPSVGFLLMDELDILKYILPEMILLKGTETINNFTHKENFLHTLKVVDNVSSKSDNIWLRWAALLHDIAKPQTKRFDPIVGFTFHGHEILGSKMVVEIFRRLKLPLNEKMLYVKKIVKMHLRPIVIAQENITDSAVRRLAYESGEEIKDLMLLCRADVTSNNPEKINKYLSNFEKIEKKIEDVNNKDKLKSFKLKISGEDIMKTFGLKPCKIVGIVKEEIKNSVIDHGIENSFEVLFNLMLEIGKKYNLKKVNEDEI